MSSPIIIRKHYHSRTSIYWLQFELLTQFLKKEIISSPRLLFRPNTPNFSRVTHLLIFSSINQNTNSWQTTMWQILRYVLYTLIQFIRPWNPNEPENEEQGEACPEKAAEWRRLRWACPCPAYSTSSCMEGYIVEAADIYWVLTICNPLSKNLKCTITFTPCNHLMKCALLSSLSRWTRFWEDK